MIYLNRMMDNFAKIDRYVRTTESQGEDSRSVNSSQSDETAMQGSEATTDSNEDLGQRRPRARRSDVRIITESRYDSLDEAAMAAAKKLYEKCGEEKPDGEKKWGIEYGIVIHKNRLNRKFYLTTIIRGTERRVDLGCGIALGRGRYRYVSDLHSHPDSYPDSHPNLHSSKSYIINELSSVDYRRTLILNVPTYVVINVGVGGTLIKFTPPNKRASLMGKKLFDDKVRELLGIRKNGALPVEKELENSILEIPRYTKIEFATKIIGENDGQLQETPISDNIKLEPLDPQAILWKYNVLNARMDHCGFHYLWGNAIVNNLSTRYKNREFTYDARHTVTNLCFPPNESIIIEKAFIGFIAVNSITIPIYIIKIGKEAFRDCTGLTSVMIPTNVAEIGEDAFRDCTGLTSVTFNGNINIIGEGAFRDCRNLRRIRLLHNLTPPLIWPKTFEGLPPTTELIVPYDSVDVYRNAEHWKNFGQRIKSL